MNNTIKVFTSFTGIGSQEMALRNIGLDFEVVGISEVDRYAILAYDAIHNEQTEVDTTSKEEMLEEIKNKNIAYNFSTNKSEIPRGLKDIKKLYDAHIRCKNYGDIRVIDENNLPDFDLFTFSFPCKSISVAGKQEGLVEGSNTQSSLLHECKRIISTKKPKYLLMENVKNLVGKNHIEEFEKLCDYLKDLGYNNYWVVLNGKDFGVPQNRERVIMISILKEFDNGYSLPIGYKLTKSLTDILDINVDKKEFFEHQGDHADEMETSLLLHLSPQLVLPLAEAGEGNEKKHKLKEFSEGWAWSERKWSQISEDTGTGNPKFSTKEKGERYFTAVTIKVANFLIGLSNADVNELYE